MAPGDRRLTLAEFTAASARVGHEASSGELSRDFGRLDRSGVGVVLFEDFCRWCAHRHVGAGFADSDEEDVERTVHYAVPSLHSAEPAQAPELQTPPQPETVELALPPVSVRCRRHHHPPSMLTPSTTLPQ